MVRAAACAAYLGGLLNSGTFWNWGTWKFLVCFAIIISKVWQDFQPEFCAEDMLSGGMGSGQLRIVTKKPKVRKRLVVDETPTQSIWGSCCWVIICFLKTHGSSWWRLFLKLSELGRITWGDFLPSRLGYSAYARAPNGSGNMTPIRKTNLILVPFSQGMWTCRSCCDPTTSPENRPHQKERIVSQPQLFKGVSLVIL